MSHQTLSLAAKEAIAKSVKLSPKEHLQQLEAKIVREQKLATNERKANRSLYTLAGIILICFVALGSIFINSL